MNLSQQKILCSTEKLSPVLSMNQPSTKYSKVYINFPMQYNLWLEASGFPYCIYLYIHPSTVILFRVKIYILTFLFYFYKIIGKASYFTIITLNTIEKKTISVIGLVLIKLYLRLIWNVLKLYSIHILNRSSVKVLNLNLSIDRISINCKTW